MKRLLLAGLIFIPSLGACKAKVRPTPAPVPTHSIEWKAADTSLTAAVEDQAAEMSKPLNLQDPVKIYKATLRRMKAHRARNLEALKEGRKPE